MIVETELVEENQRLTFVKLIKTCQSSSCRPAREEKGCAVRAS